ncbi:hypothetical protein IAU60_000574 [Kwoniella sp. DSM 27419]
MFDHHRRNYAFANTPAWLHPTLHKVLKNPSDPLGPPPIYPGLREAPWAGSWPVPKLSAPRYNTSDVTDGPLVHQAITPALLMLHIFSTPSAGSRRRRQVIRDVDLIQAIPDPYRHLIEIKFVLGVNLDIEANREEEAAIAREAETYGDLIRLKDLHNGENMNEGKTWEWLRYVGRTGGREAWWVLKCDDDTFPLLPNLLPLLLGLDPSEPTYVGTAYAAWSGYHYYFAGMMYGFSWGVVKTLAVADVTREDRNNHWDEDAKMGAVMFSLPAKPGQSLNSTACNWPDQPDMRWSIPPPSPDPCTGLNRINVQDIMLDWKGVVESDAKRAVAWHYLKKEQDYIIAADFARSAYEQAGNEYVWHVPHKLESVAETSHRHSKAAP